MRKKQEKEEEETREEGVFFHHSLYSTFLRMFPFPRFLLFLLFLLFLPSTYLLKRKPIYILLP